MLIFTQPDYKCNLIHAKFDLPQDYKKRNHIILGFYTFGDSNVYLNIKFDHRDPLELIQRSHFCFLGATCDPSLGFLSTMIYVMIMLLLIFYFNYIPIQFKNN